MSEIVASHFSRAVVFRRESKQATTQYATQHRPEDDVQRTSIELSRTPSREKDADDCNDSTGNLQQCCLVASEAEAF